MKKTATKPPVFGLGSGLQQPPITVQNKKCTTTTQAINSFPPVQSPPESLDARKSLISTKVKNLVSDTDDIEVIDILIETFKRLRDMGK